MITLMYQPPNSIEDVQAMVQTAIDLEFATLPPYLYAKMTVLPGTNAEALERIDMVVGQEMIHLCLACNIMNAIGGTVAINPPTYPHALPGSVAGGAVIHLYRFSPAAMRQGMIIEEPDEPLNPPGEPPVVPQITTGEVTIGQYYALLDYHLSQLDPGAWSAHRNQVWDNQFFAGQLFEVNSYPDAHRAISQIVSEGEGTPVNPASTGSPLDFRNELAHFYRFEEVFRNQVLTKDPNNPANPTGYRWGEPLGVDWSATYPAIDDPETFDFSGEPPAVRAAQAACDVAYRAMVDNLRQTFQGAEGGLGRAIRAMFDLRMAAIQALNTPLSNGTQVSGPTFIYR